jgi:predicted ribosome quality control (RQC) complex YloA/Tae2 family protein
MIVCSIDKSYRVNLRNDLIKLKGKRMDIQKAKHSLSEALKQLEFLEKSIQKNKGIEASINIIRWELKETERLLDDEINAGKPKQVVKCSRCQHVQEVRDMQIVKKSGVTKATQYRQYPYYYFKCVRCGWENYIKKKLTQHGRAA